MMLLLSFTVEYITYLIICLRFLLLKFWIQELHLAMEEAKPDIVGLWPLKFLNQQGKIRILHFNQVMVYKSISDV